MFRVVVALVIPSRFPVGIVLSLLLAVTYPKEAHVECFGTFLLESVVREADGSSVVSLDWSTGFRLLMAKGLQTVSNGNAFLTVEVEGARFGFGRAADDNFDDGT